MLPPDDRDATLVFRSLVLTFAPVLSQGSGVYFACDSASRQVTSGDDKTESDDYEDRGGVDDMNRHS